MPTAPSSEVWSGSSAVQICTDRYTVKQTHCSFTDTRTSHSPSQLSFVYLHSFTLSFPLQIVCTRRFGLYSVDVVVNKMHPAMHRIIPKSPISSTSHSSRHLLHLCAEEIGFLSVFWKGSMKLNGVVLHFSAPVFISVIRTVERLHVVWFFPATL